MRPLERVALELPAGVGPLGEYRSKRLLAAYGIPCVDEVLIPVERLGDLAGLRLRFPVAVKIESPDLPHKTEAGAVRLGVGDLPSLERAAQEVIAAARAFTPAARIEGVIVAEMVSGLECIMGAVCDRYFGPVVLFGVGGITTELIKDVAYRFAPFDAQTGREMIEDIRLAPLFKGYRGRPALDVTALAGALSRLSWLIADHADRIAEIDVNPLFVRADGQGVAAADALIVTHSAAAH